VTISMPDSFELAFECAGAAAEPASLLRPQGRPIAWARAWPSSKSAALEQIGHRAWFFFQERWFCAHAGPAAPLQPAL